MAIVVFDGFDHYANQTDLQSRVGAIQWSDIYLTLFSSLAFLPGRGGYGQSLAMLGGSDGGFYVGGSFATLTDGFLGFAMLNAAVGQSWVDVSLMNYPSTAPILTFRCYPDSGIVQAFTSVDPYDSNGSTPITTTAPNVCSAFVWQTIEIGWTASGGFDFHVAGVSVLKSSSGFSGECNGLRIRCPNGPGLAIPTIQIDDFWLCDATTGPGSIPANTFMGDVSVRTLRPIANWSISWSPLTGANWQEVGEALFDGDTSYNAATSVGAQDLFTFQPLPTTTSVVFGVQVTGAYRKQDASAQTIVQNIVSGGTAAASAPYTLSLSYTYSTSLFVLDPHTNATWTPASVDLLIAGYELA